MVPQGLTLPQLGWSYGIEKLLFMTMTRARRFEKALMLLARTQRPQDTYTDRCGPKRKIHKAHMVRDGKDSRKV